MSSFLRPLTRAEQDELTADLTRWEKQLIPPWVPIDRLEHPARTAQQAMSGYPSPEVGFFQGTLMVARMPARIEYGIDYAMAMHELGHIVAKQNGLSDARTERVENETAAENWAIENALPKWRGMVAEASRAPMTGYIAAGRGEIGGMVVHGGQTFGQHYNQYLRLYSEHTGTPFTYDPEVIDLGR